MSIRRWFSSAALALFILAGCSTGQAVTAEQIVERMQQTREQTNDAHAVVEATTTGSRGDGQFRVEVWLRKSDQTDAAGKPLGQLHAKVLEASEQELAGSEIVSDGTTVWLYNPARNTVVTGDLDDLRQGEMAAQDPTAQMLHMQEQLQQVIDGSEVELLAENEQVAGRATWKVRLTPNAETTAQMQLGSAIETTLWVEHGTYLPLQIEVTASDLGSFRASALQLETNQGVDAARFSFTPPAGAEIVDAAELAQRARPATTTLEQARSEVSFPLLAPGALPEGVQLDEVQILNMDGQTVIQNYSGTISFSLVQTQSDGLPGAGDAPFGARSETVTVRGQEGTLITGGGAEQGTMLRWQENGVTIIVAGTLDRTQALDFAAGLQ